MLKRGLHLVIILLEIHVVQIFKEAVFISKQAASNANTINL